MTHLDDVLCAIAACGNEHAVANWDFDTIRAVLEPFSDFTTETLGPTNAVADRQGCVVENGRVRMPQTLKTAYAAYVELGWHQLPIPTELGGAGAPPEIACAGVELLAHANHAFQMVVGLVPGAIAVIRAFGTEAQRQQLLAPLISGEALATMCLSESEAGSDLARIRCRATALEDGNYRLDGEKIFVSGGDQDLSETIIHLVLARTGAMEDGIKGLSLFACPARRTDGTANTVRLLRIEEKLGLHASPTCQLIFDGAEASLIGAPGEGLKAMFVMMDHARLDVAMQGVAHAARAHQLAESFARERVQGRVSGSPVTIDRHGDVARMLAHMDILALGSRAMVMRTATCLTDQALAAFLTPVCKVWCTEAATTAADLGMQVLGGYGYLNEYGLEQIWRDARITRIYEGTNGVLAMTMVNRLLKGNNGVFRTAFEAEIEASMTLDAPLSNEIAHLFFTWRSAATQTLISVDHGLLATPFMRLTGLLYFLCCWQRLIAHGDPQSNRAITLTELMKALLLPEAEMLTHQCKDLAAYPRD